MAAPIKKKKSSILTKNGRIKLNGLSRSKLEGIFETAKPKLKDKITNRYKLIK
jgi:hypothetical protein